jgi:L-alanine-DL-glutamate epimerase-like enolase superfamily enzyme
MSCWKPGEGAIFRCRRSGVNHSFRGPEVESARDAPHTCPEPTPVPRRECRGRRDPRAAGGARIRDRCGRRLARAAAPSAVDARRHRAGRDPPRGRERVHPHALARGHRGGQPDERTRLPDPVDEDRIIPFFLGKDARDLPGLLEGVYRHESNYKLAGLAFWNPVGWLEVSLLDLLGRVANQSIAAMLGGVRRREVPIYVSSTQRDIEPEAEADRFLRRMADTGARAVKCKVGGRMSRNADASPGRTERIVPVLRTRLGDDVTLYADANGSYDVPRGIEVGRLLEAHGVAIYEEPCTT